MRYTYKDISSFYYPHKYVHFDHLCQTIDDRLDCIDKYIQEGTSTPDFELEKYIIADDTTCMHYILNKYPISNWEHIIITAIVCKSSPTILIHMFSAYSVRTGKEYKQMKWFDEILYVSITSHVEMFCLICQLCEMEDEWTERLKEHTTEQEIHTIVENMFTWDICDSTNPRNLLYALKKGDIDTALFLIENGVQVDIWNNYCTKLIIDTPSLKMHPVLFKRMLASGAKIPKHTIKSAKQKIEYLSSIRNNFNTNNIFEM